MPSYSRPSAVFRISASLAMLSALADFVPAMLPQPASSATVVADNAAWPPRTSSVRRDGISVEIADEFVTIMALQLLACFVSSPGRTIGPPRHGKRCDPEGGVRGARRPAAVLTERRRGKMQAGEDIQVAGSTGPE